MEKPKQCCRMGSYDHTIPMPIGGRMRGIDFCVADIVAALNAANIPTTASCCGHNTLMPIVSLKDGRQLAIYPDMQTWLALTKGGDNE